MLLSKPLVPSAKTPLYLQLRDNVRQAIHDSELAYDQMLPTERELAQQLAVSRVTVRKALEGLVKEGLLERRQGAGTFVSNRIQKHTARLTSFSEDMSARGRMPENVYLVKEVVSASPDEVIQLGVSLGDQVWRIHRLRLANGEPLAVEYACVPASALSGVDDIGSSLYEALEACGNRPVRALQRIRAISFGSEVSELLGITPGSAGLQIERRGFLSSGVAVEYCVSYYKGEAYDFVAELEE